MNYKRILHRKKCSYHLKKSHESIQRIVKVDVRVHPAISFLDTFGFILYNAYRKPFFVVIDTFEKPPTEKLYAHDAEDQPEYQTDQ